MNVFIDVGNSRIKWKTVSSETDGNLNAFSYLTETLLAQLDEFLKIPGQQNTNVYISNVAGEKIKSKLIQWFADRFNVEPKFAVSRSEMCGLISAYNQPERLGIDRFLAMLGAQIFSSGPKVVVDCGTATTVDCINSEAKFIGGVIFPGLGLMQASLSGNTNALSAKVANEGVTLFATDSATAISSGTILATTGLIENTVKALSIKCDSEVKCIITGGDGKIIQSYLNVDSDYQEDLVLKGLSVYFQAE